MLRAARAYRNTAAETVLAAVTIAVWIAVPGFAVPVPVTGLAFAVALGTTARARCLWARPRVPFREPVQGVEHGRGRGVRVVGVVQ